MEQELFKKVSNGELTIEEAMEQLRISKQKRPDNKLRVTNGHKQNICVYGLQKMPVTLYASQWVKLLAFSPVILEYIENNADELKWDKDDNATPESNEEIKQKMMPLVHKISDLLNA
tara:strand:- start:319 stop:669 length:351 start_codon:yes stop_codon:yes gene_type:complete